MSDPLIEYEDSTQTGKTLYALARNAAGLWLNDTTPEAYNAADWTSYAIALTETGASGYFTASTPALPAGTYVVGVRLRAGATPAVSDLSLGSFEGYWDGVSWHTGPAFVDALNPTLMQLLTRQLSFFGATTPVTQDTYETAGFYNGKVYYQSTTLGTPMYVWWNGGNWILSTAVGTDGAAYFQSGNSNTASNYSHQGTATGTAIGTIAGGAMLDPYQPGGPFAANVTAWDGATQSITVDGNGYPNVNAADLAGTNAGSAPAWYTTPPTSSAIAGAVWTNATRTLSSFSFAVQVGSYSAGQDPATLVLNATAANYDTAGSIGAAIQAGGSGGNPWATVMANATTYGQAVRRIASLIGGQLTESADHTQSSFADMGDPTTTVVTSTQTATSRVVTFLH